MTIHLSIVVFLPLAAGVAAAFAPRGAARWVVLAGTVGVLGYAIALLADFDRGAGLQYVTDDSWIQELGIRYSLGVDGLNVLLIALTALLWVVAAAWAAMGEWERPRLFFFHLALGETAVLGAFCAQDLALFVLFFDLMLVPFYFLIGAWGGRNRVGATTKFVIYTLVGSLLMLAAAVAIGVESAPQGAEVSFSIAELAKRPLSGDTQEWVFLLFALAFLIKAPVFPLHGWMPDTYRAAPLPVLLLLSAVLSKVGVYAFLKIVLPILPEASHQFQELMIVIAVVSILYGSVLAFSQDDVRLVVGYSSIAQLGFIILGIFALDQKGAQGALFQMVNHALVAAALFVIIGAIAVRARGSERISELGGMALRAPVLAALFLIVTFATLAMPGSGNFVGELLILFGSFEDKLVYGLVASVGVALAAVYMIRLYQRTMHNRAGPAVESRDLSAGELGVLAPLVAVILFLGVYPQFALERSDRSARDSIAAARAVAKPPAAAAPEALPPPGAAPPNAPGAQDAPPAGAEGPPPGVQVEPGGAPEGPP